MFRRILSPFVLAAATFFGSAGAGAQAPSGDAAPTPSVQTKASQAEMTPVRALERLKEGNARFAEGRGLPRNLPAKVSATAAGQYPFAAIVSCMDSRAPIEIVFDQAIGDVFSLRVAGNVVDPNFLGSLEYAVKVVGVKLLVVLGHSQCGAVKGAIDGVKMGNLTGLLAEIQPAIEAAGPKKSSKDTAYVARVAEQNVRVAMREIHQKSPILEEMIRSGAVGLVGGMYDLESGRVTFYAD
jgi:carbonic anhydrase